MSCASSFHTSPDGTASRSGGVPRRGLEFVGIVLAFFYFWPAALAYIAWKVAGYPVPSGWRDEAAQAWRRGAEAFSFRDVSRFSRPGNHAFEEYRRSELKRLDEERRRLDEEARAFSDFVDDLKRAKDREEFDAFMNKRRSGTTSV